MRIQTRLFLGTALLVLALMAVQWWLHVRQLRAVESELGVVAASVGKDIIRAGSGTFVSELKVEGDPVVWVDGDDCAPEDVGAEVRHDVRVIVIPEQADAEVTHRITRKVLRRPPDSHVELDEEGIRVEADRASALK